MSQEFLTTMLYYNILFSKASLKLSVFFKKKSNIEINVTFCLEIEGGGTLIEYKVYAAILYCTHLHT